MSLPSLLKMLKAENPRPLSMQHQQLGTYRLSDVRLPWLQSKLKDE